MGLAHAATHRAWPQALHAGARAPRCLRWPAPALASSRRSVAGMTDGPFYPPRAWREQWTDWDADLSRVQRDGRTLERARRAAGAGAAGGRRERPRDRRRRGRDLAMRCARRPTATRGVRLVGRAVRRGFQGFGASRSDRDGRLRFRSIKPVPYPGRTPHIHVKLRHAELRRSDLAAVHRRRPGQRARLPVARGRRRPTARCWRWQLQPAAADSGLRWQVRQALVRARLNRPAALRRQRSAQRDSGSKATISSRPSGVSA